MNFIRMTLLLFRNELRIEFRSKEILYSTLLFAIILVLLFSFGFSHPETPSQAVLSLLFWTSLAFVGLLTIQKSFAREQQHHMMQTLWITPIPRFAIYLSKFFVVILLMTIASLSILGCMVLFLNLQISSFPLFFLVMFLGIFGFSSIACLFSSAIRFSKTGAILLPLLVYPLSIPLFIATTAATTAILYDPSLSATYDPLLFRNQLWQNILPWIKFLSVFDACFMGLSVWLFEPLCEAH